MKLSPFPFSVTDWNNVPVQVFNGITGHAEWKTVNHDGIRIRLVTYSANYLADHWCNKGHIIYCSEGEMETELKDGRKFTLSTGMMYTVGDNSDAHRTYSENGCTLFIVD